METQGDPFELPSRDRMTAMSAEELLRTIKAVSTPAPDAPPPDDQLLADFLDANLPEGDVTYVKLMLVYQPWRDRLVELISRGQSPTA